MGFIPISIKNYIKKHLKNNPSEDEKDLRRRLNAALKDYKNGVKCSCGNDIWVIGSAIVGNMCFTCMTGESYPSDDYEIAAAVKKNSSIDTKHIDEMEAAQIHGFFDDDGNEINLNFIKKPSLCLTCRKDNDPSEEFLCNMTRYDQKDDKEFKCFAYRRK